MRLRELKLVSKYPVMLPIVNSVDWTFQFNIGNFLTWSVVLMFQHDQLICGWLIFSIDRSRIRYGTPFLFWARIFLNKNSMSCAGGIWIKKHRIHHKRHMAHQLHAFILVHHHNTHNHNNNPLWRTGTTLNHVNAIKVHAWNNIILSLLSLFVEICRLDKQYQRRRHRWH